MAAQRTEQKSRCFLVEEPCRCSHLRARLSTGLQGSCVQCWQVWCTGSRWQGWAGRAPQPKEPCQLCSTSDRQQQHQGAAEEGSSLLASALCQTGCRAAGQGDSVLGLHQCLGQSDSSTSLEKDTATQNDFPPRLTAQGLSFCSHLLANNGFLVRLPNNIYAGVDI